MAVKRALWGGGRWTEYGTRLRCRKS